MNIRGFGFPKSLTVIAALAFSLVMFPLAADKKTDKKKESDKKETKQDKQRSKSLRQETSDQYLKKWLDQDVSYIITSEERAAFKRLTTDEERYQFIEQFWLRRDPSPDTIENEFRDEHYRRIAYANERFSSGFPGWKTDRGRVYITWGPPDEIDAHPSGGSYVRSAEEGGGTTSTYPFEVWRYRYLPGADLGNEVELEFVDTSGSNEYHLTMDPYEKDALRNIPNAGLTYMEELGLASQSDRAYGSPGHYEANSSTGTNSQNNKQFDVLQRYAAIFKPPEVKFKDLEAVVNTKISYNLLPFAFRMDYIKITDNTVLTPISIQLQNHDLTFQNKDGIQRAVVNIYGRISTITGRQVQVFEDAVTIDSPESLFKQTLDRSSRYQKQLPVVSGTYKLELVVKDLNSGNAGTIYKSFTVPKYPDDQLATSSVILADKIEKLSSKQIGAGQFIIGGSKVFPNVKDTPAFSRNTAMGVWFQVYNLALDEKTHKPSANIEYVLRNGDKEVSRFMEDKDVLSGAAEQLTIEKLVPLADLAPGKYSLAVNVTDNLSNRTISQIARFEVQ